MRKILFLISILALVVVVYFFFKPKSIHYHAGFQIYKDNALLDLSGLEYMNLKPCGEHDEILSPEEEQIEKAHLHDFTGDVAHVHREGALWSDLFKNIKIEINPAEAYINGQKTENILTVPIKAYDSIVIFEGENSDIETKLESRVTIEHIKEAESKSENCGS